MHKYDTEFQTHLPSLVPLKYLHNAQAPVDFSGVDSVVRSDPEFIQGFDIVNGQDLLESYQAQNKDIDHTDNAWHSESEHTFGPRCTILTGWTRRSAMLRPCCCQYHLSSQTS